MNPAVDDKVQVVITRPSAAGQHLVQMLNDRGISGVHMPLLSIVATAESTTHKSILLDLDRFGRVIVVSANAARYFVEALDRYWPQPPLGVDYFAVGKASAQVLRDYGLFVRTPARANSEGLLAMPELQPAAATLIAKGEAGRPLLAQTLQQRGSKVSQIDFYRRVDNRLSSVQLSLLQQKPAKIVAITSAQALNCWQQNVPELTTQTLVCASSRIADLARQLGYQSVFIADGADNEAQLRCIVSLFEAS